MKALVAGIRRALHGPCAVPLGAPLMVAVSGGADSMALLHGLARLPRRDRHALVVAHLDHGLRGEASREDARFVREWAGKLGVPFHGETVSVRDAAERTREGLETTARHLRHQFLARMAVETGVAYVALAHHARDQAELFFLRLMRGSGTEGLAGMRHRGPSSAEPSVTLVRPLLEESPEALREALASEGLPWREDATNEDTSIPRNAIRHGLLPVLRRLAGPSAEALVVRAMSVLREESDFVDAALERALMEGQAMEGLPLALRRRAVVRQLIALGHEPTHELVAHLAQRPGKARHVAGGGVVVADGGAGGEVRRAQEAGRPGPGVRGRRPIRVPLKGESGVAALPDGRMEWAVTTRRPDVRRARAEQGKAWMDAGVVGAWLRLRRWRAGDRFRPLGAPGSAKVGDLFTNRRVPLPERAGRWVAEARDGTLCWVEGWPCGESFKVTPGTRRFLRIQLKRAKVKKAARASNG